MQIPFSFWKVLPPGWPTGADGALSINGTTVNINAGDVKDYSSISIINNGILNVRGYASLGFGTNNGTAVTIIGCSGNFTVNTGGVIRLIEDACGPSDVVSGSSYNATSPAGAVVTTPSYTAHIASGGTGGTSGIWPFPGSDAGGVGHGGGGSGYDSGGNSSSGTWGTSGAGSSYGSDGGIFGGPAGHKPNVAGFATTGGGGGYGEAGEGYGEGFGGGGAGGVRGRNGGCLYLQVAGTVSVSGVVINASGGNGGGGGAGGGANSADYGYGYGGGGGAGGAGGGGGKVIVRYKLGSIVSGNINVAGGSGGPGGAGGTDDGGGGNHGTAGNPGTNGTNGSTDIATY
jgi:hypothetical protein